MGLRVQDLCRQVTKGVITLFHPSPFPTLHFFATDCNFQFIQGNQFHYKNQRCSELDIELGDLTSLICDSEQDIIRQLEVQLRGHEGHLHDTSAALAELDVLIGLSCVAFDLNYVRPEVRVNSTELYIKAGRHPLQEFIVENFIPVQLDPDLHYPCCSISL
jgi:DNA mismatch repair ATPase MutS